MMLMFGVAFLVLFMKYSVAEKGSHAGSQRSIALGKGARLWALV